jgi:DNA polymerase-1
MSKLLAVDGNNLLMRALHATKRAALSAHGVPTGPLLVFVNSLAKHVREERPDRLAVAWDGGGVGERHRVDSEYKANRHEAPDAEHELKESSFALAREFCRHAGIHQVGYPEQGIEADDVIAAWWRGWIWEESRGEMVILSSDKDFLQLVDCGDVEQVRLSSANTPTDRWDSGRVRDHYGVPARCVSAILAIAGDTSDNVVGVHGIGPKKAAKALRDAGLDFERCIQDNWPQDVDRLRANYQLVDLRSGWHHPQAPRPAVPPEMRLVGPSHYVWSSLKHFLDQYELTTICDRLEAGSLWVGPSSATKMGRPLKLR